VQAALADGQPSGTRGPDADHKSCELASRAAKGTADLPPPEPLAWRRLVRRSGGHRTRRAVGGGGLAPARISGPAGPPEVPEDQTALEDITPHPQLSTLLTQPGQLSPLVLAQLSAAGLPPPPVSTDPVLQRARADPQVPGDLRDRLTGLPDQPDRALPPTLCRAKTRS